MNGDVGNDKGDGSCNGVEGVPKLDGKDNLDSDDTKLAFDCTPGLSGGSDVHRTVGRDIFSELLLVDDFCSLSGESAILFWKRRKTILSSLF